MATLADLAQEEFVSLTTYRRTGDVVSVAVWIAPASDPEGGLLITTTQRSGKVKRLRRDRRVQLRPCDRRGAVAANAPTVSAQAEVISDAPEVRRLREVIRHQIRTTNEGHRGRSGHRRSGGARPGHLEDHRGADRSVRGSGPGQALAPRRTRSSRREGA